MRSYTYTIQSILIALSLALLPSVPTLLGMEGSGMMIASRNGMVVSKPLPYDAEVEYLESTGTQYALTNIKPKVGDIYSVDAVVQYASNVSSNTWLTGWWTGVDCSSLFGTYQNQLYFTYNRDDNIAKTSVGLYDKHRIRYNFPHGIFIDDTQLSSTVAANTPLTVIPDGRGFIGLPIFRSYSVPPDGYPLQTNIKARLFNFSIIINGIVVFEGIPVRFTNELGVSEGAMYDRVSGQLFRNAGTGAFVFPTA